ncbi:MAG TPA: PqqD family protein [Acidimicrobiales bacterium]|nr:PqqD family protein [Acidimicrobiales bacterium]
MGKGMGMEADWPFADSVPVSRDGASAVELDDNVAVYDEVGQLMILLNSSAASVWMLCDGATSVDAMVQALAAAHPDDAEVIGEDVRQTLRKLAELGLVSDPSAPGGATG